MELANSILTLQPGMYILRHPKTGMPPLSISRAAGNATHSGRIEALYTPGTHGGILREGKDCIVMQVLDAPVDLLVTAYLEKSGVAVPTLKVDKIALEAEGAPSGLKSIEVPAKGISILGHIERMGDVLATLEKTLGDPTIDLRVEGFQIMWPDKPEGVELMYSTRVEGAALAPMVSTGTFSGTRNAAQRIVQVIFQLTGPSAGEYELGGIAHFSGGFNSPLSSGRKLSGPSGLEHLTGLSISIKPRTLKNRNPWAASPQTRVLKNRTNSAKKAA